MFQTPAIVLSLLLASLLAAVFLMWQGRPLRHLPIFWLASAAGFVAGQLAGEEAALATWVVGQVRIVEASLGSLLFLLVLTWLKRERKTT
jgi:hypothetical protein